MICLKKYKYIYLSRVQISIFNLHETSLPIQVSLVIRKPAFQLKLTISALKHFVPLSLIYRKENKKHKKNTSFFFFTNYF